MYNEYKMNYLFGFEQFREAYLQLSEEDRRKVWILVKTSDGQDIYLSDYNQWLTIGDYCKKMQVTIDSVSLKYSSREVTKNTIGADGVYLSKTAKGKMGGETKHCYGIGYVKDGIVNRTLWTTPELIEDVTFEDSVEGCIQRALVMYDKEKA